MVLALSDNSYYPSQLTRLSSSGGGSRGGAGTGSHCDISSSTIALIVRTVVIFVVVHIYCPLLKPDLMRNSLPTLYHLTLITAL